MRGTKTPQTRNLPYLKHYRVKLRHRLTPAEATLWKTLKNSQLDGRKFRRQHSIGNYILDFFCPAERLGIELDGECHNSDQSVVYDHQRKLFLAEQGIKVLRFENRAVYEEYDSLLAIVRMEFGWWAK
jgi:very-short-patch-repair endonuclease